MVSALHLPDDASIFCFKKWAVFELHHVSFRLVLVITTVTWETHFNNRRKYMFSLQFHISKFRECLSHVFFFLSTFVGLSAFKTPESHPLSDNTKYYEFRNRANITATCWKIWY